jgi:dienelactone hydrolase
MTHEISITTDRLVNVPAGSVTLEGNLVIPDGAQSLVLFAHGSGSSRHSPRNKSVAEALRKGGLATLLIDLLTAEEDEIDRRTRQLRFDIQRLADRLVEATDWLLQHDETQELDIGYFGSSTGAAAALIAVTERPDAIHAVVSRGGRVDLAGDAIPKVRAPTLLIVGGEDLPVLALSRQAMPQLQAEKRLEVIPGAGHLFEEPGKLDEVAHLARVWFQRHLTTFASEPK